MGLINSINPHYTYEVVEYDPQADLDIVFCNNDVSCVMETSVGNIRYLDLIHTPLILHFLL